MQQSTQIYVSDIITAFNTDLPRLRQWTLRGILPPRIRNAPITPEFISRLAAHITAYRGSIPFEAQRLLAKATKAQEAATNES